MSLLTQLFCLLILYGAGRAAALIANGPALFCAGSGWDACISRSLRAAVGTSFESD